MEKSYTEQLHKSSTDAQVSHHYFNNMWNWNKPGYLIASVLAQYDLVHITPESISFLAKCILL